MTAIPIFIFLGVVILIVIIGFSSQDSGNKRQQPPIAPRNEGYSPKGGYYNLADEIRQKAGRQPGAPIAKPKAKKPEKPKTDWTIEKTKSSIKPSNIRPTVLVKYSYQKLKPSKLQTVSKSKITVIEEKTGSTVSPLYQRLAYSDDITEEGNKAVLEAMILGEVLYKPKWKERYRF